MHGPTKRRCAGTDVPGVLELFDAEQQHPLGQLPGRQGGSVGGESEGSAGVVQPRQLRTPPTGAGEQLGPEPAVRKVQQRHGDGVARVRAAQRSRDECVRDDDRGAHLRRDVSDLRRERTTEEHLAVLVDVVLEPSRGRRRNGRVAASTGALVGAQQHRLVRRVAEPIREP